MARRGVSSAAAAVVIAAAAVTVTVAVAVWLVWWFGSFTLSPAVKITHATLEPVQTGDTTKWRLTLLIRNNGADAVKLLFIRVKGVVIDVPDGMETIEPGKVGVVVVKLPSDIQFQPGERVDIQVVTADGVTLSYTVKARAG